MYNWCKTALIHLTVFAPKHIFMKSWNYIKGLHGTLSTSIKLWMAKNQLLGYYRSLASFQAPQSYI